MKKDAAEKAKETLLFSSARRHSPIDSPTRAAAGGDASPGQKTLLGRLFSQLKMRFGLVLETKERYLAGSPSWIGSHLIPIEFGKEKECLSRCQPCITTTVHL